ncbi:hypothetical protein LINPERHAP2_LOCUS39707 [Linum perenne]
MQYFNNLAVNRIGNYIRKTVRMDLATAEGALARYARNRVEVDLTKPLLGKYIIEHRELLIEYESLSNICFSCGLYGHKEDNALLLSSANLRNKFHKQIRLLLKLKRRMQVAG